MKNYYFKPQKRKQMEIALVVFLSVVLICVTALAFNKLYVNGHNSGLVQYDIETQIEFVEDSLQLNPADPYHTPVDQEDAYVIYAGRFSDAPDSRYSTIGTPLNRDWLTKDEWDGNHIRAMKLSPFDKRKLMSRFKTWKELHKIDFIAYVRQAVEEEKLTFPKLNVSVFIAQAILESNWGLSELAANANNLFGHKFHGQKEGFLVMADDSPTDKFTKFRSEWFSCRAHSMLLMRKYGKRIKGYPSTKKWLHALCGGMTLQQSQAWVDRGGQTYATACYKNSRGGKECYGELLERIIRSYDL